MTFVTGGLFQGENRIRRRPKIVSKILLKRLFQGESKVAVTGAVSGLVTFEATVIQVGVSYT